MRKQTFPPISSKKVQYFLVIILGGVAVVLGILVARDYLFIPQKQTLAPKDSEVSPKTEKPSESTSSPQMRQLPTNLTDEEKALLNPPALDASVGEKDTHFKLGESMAKEAELLNLNKCEKPSPLVLKLKDGAEFKVRNDDNTQHTIVIDQDHQYPVGADKTITLKAEFGKGQGLYGYLCDGLPGVVGFFFVTPK